MTPDRRNQISELYHAALERTPEERSAFLKNPCDGDEALRLEVESLLRHEAAPARFLERPAAHVVAVAVEGAGGVQMLNRQLGPYTIVAPLGAGGMGEVYRAREARLLATLNHPQICAINGLEETDGVAALVLELVEGPTLTDRLARGPLATADALAIARQIAEALDAAHEKGIVHRDLKPANVVLQSSANASGVPSGTVRAKVLDFGLAKITPRP